MNQSLDTHNDLIVQPYKNGIKILRPPKQTGRDRSHLTKTPTLKDILELPCNVYLLNRESKVVNGNLSNARSVECDSVKESIGKSMLNTSSTPESAAKFMANDRLVETNEKASFYEEFADKKNATPINFLSVKLPWYDMQDKILGIFGFGIVLGEQPIAESLSAISRLGLLHAFQSKIHSFSQIYKLDIHQQICLTSREAEILQLIIKGKICPDIALITKLSKRTVEHYIATLKGKFNVTSKSELIEKVLHIMRTYHLDI